MIRCGWGRDACGRLGESDRCTAELFFRSLLFPDFSDCTNPYRVEIRSQRRTLTLLQNNFSRSAHLHPIPQSFQTHLTPFDNSGVYDNERRTTSTQVHCNSSEHHSQVLHDHERSTQVHRFMAFLRSCTHESFTKVQASPKDSSVSAHTLHQIRRSPASRQTSGVQRGTLWGPP